MEKEGGGSERPSDGEASEASRQSGREIQGCEELSEEDESDERAQGLSFKLMSGGGVG